MCRAAKCAETNWVRVQADMSLGAYDASAASGELGEPLWPTETLGQLLKIAFKESFIEDFDHPVLRKLRGEL